MNGYTDLNSITDPTDFRNTTLPKFFEIDSLLRCHICKELLSSPTLTSCGHTFCSGCVRKYLMHTPKCPICAKELRESNLNRNVVVEQLVISYKGLRSELLDKIKIRKEPDRIDEEASEIKVKPEDTNIPKPVQKPEVIDLDDDDVDDFDDSLNDELMILEETKKRKQPLNIDSMLKKQKTSTLPRRTVIETGICPICTKSFPLEILQTRHIDECLTTASKPSHSQSVRTHSPAAKTMMSQRKPPTPTTYDTDFFQPKEAINSYKKLTKLDYSSLSTTQLKSKLSKLELPTSGIRHELEVRYNEYLVLWNANCDSVQPKNPKLLRSQLAKWESAIKVKTGDSEKLDKEGWNDLIKKARNTLKGKTTSTEDTDKEITED